jgi:hypothetical protein
VKQRCTETKSKRWGKIYHAWTNQKQAAVAIFKSDKADFMQKSVSRHKEVHHILIKEKFQKFQQEIE